MEFEALLDLGTIPQWLTFFAAFLTFIGVVIGFTFTFRQLRHNQHVRQTENILSVSGSTIDHNTSSLEHPEALAVIQKLEGLNVPAAGFKPYWTARGVHLSHINLACRVWELAGQPGHGEPMNSRFDGWERFSREVIAKKLRGCALAVRAGGTDPADLAGSDLWLGLHTYEVYPTKFTDWLDGLAMSHEVDEVVMPSDRTPDLAACSTSAPQLRARWPLGQPTNRRLKEGGMTKPLSREQQPPVRDWLPWVGAVGSAIWIAAGAYLMVFHGDRQNPIKPNEWGDIFAGLAAPVAFLWLVLGFFQQGRELKISTRALQLQARELQNSVEQQAQLVATTREQLTVNVREQERQRLADNEAAQPRFVFKWGGSTTANGVTRCSMQLVNEGHTATDLKFRYAPPPMEVPFTYLPAIRRGEDVAMSIGIVQTRFPDEGMMIWIDYTDGRNRPGLLRYRAYYDDFEKSQLKFAKVEDTVPTQPTAANTASE